MYEFFPESYQEARARFLTCAAAAGAEIFTINLLGVNLGWLIGGTVVIETVFSVPGLGSLLVSSIFTRDYMVVMGITMAFACAIVIVNFIVDIATVALDPRIEL